MIGGALARTQVLCGGQQSMTGVAPVCRHVLCISAGLGMEGACEAAVHHKAGTSLACKKGKRLQALPPAQV